MDIACLSLPMRTLMRRPASLPQRGAVVKRLPEWSSGGDDTWRQAFAVKRHD